MKKPDHNDLVEFVSVSFIILFFLVLFLSGCSSLNTSSDTQISTGLGQLWETKPKYNAVIIVHCEIRPPESAISKFIGVFENIAGWPQAVASVLTGPERMTDAVVGGDRWEMMIAIGGPDKSIIEEVAVALEQADLTHNEKCSLGQNVQS